MLDLLKSVRVLDASSIVMGPMAGQILGDLGAEVIKLEPPSGDLARTSGTPGPDGTGALFANNNRNKLGVVADLKTMEGQRTLASLLERCDVVLHNMRPAAAARIGLDAETVRRGRPSIVHCAAVGYGSDGPYAGRPAYDDIIQAAGGLAGLSMRVGGEPAYVPSIVADKIGGLHIVYAVLAALLARERTGRGRAIEVPMFECLAAFLMNEHLDAASFDADGKAGYERLLNPHRRPHATADGWLAVMPYDERHWRAILEEMGETAIPAEPWFADPAQRNARSGVLYHRLATGLTERPTAAWIAVCESGDIPYAQVNSIDDLLTDPHLAARGFFSATDPFPGRVRSVPLPVRFSDTASGPDRAAPGLGEHTAEILDRAGRE
ncbi:MAG: CoA transferase [Rhizobiales bacterium]|nr:CoA transferase [Hyphomicrobiales bacterium]MBA69651.1 CoA transferase [Hyphomicrobiales bacterium]